MSLQEFFSDPGSVRTALFGLAAAAVIGALIASRIKQKLHPEPRVIRLTLDQDTASLRPAVDLPPQTSEPVTEVSRAAETIKPSVVPESSAITVTAAVAQTNALDGLSPVRGRSEPAAMADLAVMSECAGPAAQVPLAVAIPEHVIEEAPRAQARLVEAIPECVIEEAPPAQAPITEAIPGPAGEEPQPAQASAAIYPLLALQERSPVMLDVLRGAIILCAILVIGAFLLVVLPQGAVDKIASALRPRNAPGPPPEKIAFLYLGDEIKDNQFHIRGVVRNISGQPLEQLQATVRLYAVDRTLLETQVVRMDSEIIFPNNTASFHLSFSDYRGQFGSYSLDFKLAQGDPVLYKDMREARASS